MKPRPRTSRTWVVPNRNTIGLVAVLLGMWWAGLSQSNGAAYLLCFVLASVAMVSAMHAWANLQGVEFTADPIRPVFMGQERTVTLRARSTRRRDHFALSVAPMYSGVAAQFSQVPHDGESSAVLRALALERGHLSGLTVRIESRYPLGFFSAYRDVWLSVAHWVYPGADGARRLPLGATPTRGTRDGARIEGDDFGGVRAWRAGESQRHIDWKAAARGQPLLIKQWTGEADTTVEIDWESLPGLLPEPRLSQLTQWVVQAERGGGRYALRLPGTGLPASRGEAHFHQCLRALAGFREEEKR